MINDYRVEAQGRVRTGGSRPERYLIITDSRDRALHFAGVFRASAEYEWVSVTVGGKCWLGSRIGEIP